MCDWRIAGIDTDEHGLETQNNHLTEGNGGNEAGKTLSADGAESEPDGV
jgi:hypothetical protein